MSWSKVSDFMPSFFRNPGTIKQVQASLIVEEARKIIAEKFGPESLEQAKPLYYKDKKLTIAVLSSPLLSELRFAQAELLERLNSTVGRGQVEAIRFVA